MERGNSAPVVELSGRNTYPISRSNNMSDTITEFRPSVPESVEVSRTEGVDPATSSVYIRTKQETHEDIDFELDPETVDSRAAFWEAGVEFIGADLTPQQKAEIRVKAQKGITVEAVREGKGWVLREKSPTPREVAYKKDQRRQVVDTRLKVLQYHDKRQGIHSSPEREMVLRERAEKNIMPQLEGGSGPEPIMGERGEDISRLHRELFAILSDPLVEAQLKSHKPDLSKFKELDDFMRRWGQASESEYIYLAKIFATYADKGDRNPDGTPVTDHDKYLEVYDPTTFHTENPDNPRMKYIVGESEYFKISDEARKLLFEWTLERMIGTPDEGPEDDHYNIGSSIQLSDNKDKLRTVLLENFGRGSKHEDAHFVEQMLSLEHVRQVMHELRIAVNNSEEYTKYIAGIRLHGLAFVRNEVAGISTVIAALEQASQQRVAKVKTIFTQDDVASIEAEVMTKMEFMQKNGLLKDDSGRPLTHWEMLRAIKMGQAYFGGLQRFGIYTGIGGLQGSGTAKIGSSPYEYQVRRLHPFKIFGMRFFGGEKASSYFIKNIIKNVYDFEKGTDRKGDRSRTMYGVSRDVIAANNQFGINDLIDGHSWRSQLAYMGNIDVTEDGGASSYTLLSKINDIAAKHGYELDPVTGTYEKEGDKNEVSKDLSDYLLGQRLYLSMMVRHVPINAALRGDIWRKTATLNPLTIAAMKPEMFSVAEREFLDSVYSDDGNPIRGASFMYTPKGSERTLLSLRAKIEIAQQARIDEDAKLYFDEHHHGAIKARSTTDITVEAGKYKRFMAFEDLLRERGKETLSAEERQFYEDAKRGYKLKVGKGEDDAVALNEAGYQRWLALDKKALAGGMSTLSSKDLEAYNASVTFIKHDLLTHFTEKNGNTLSQREREMVEKMIDSGFVFGEELGKTRHAWTTGIVDAPKVALVKRGIGKGEAGLSDVDLVRVVGDQNTVGEAFHHMMGWIEHPVDHYVEAPTEFVAGYGKVYGRHHAQEVVMPVVAAWTEGTFRNKKARWFSSIMRDGEFARSEWEHYFPTSNLAWEAEVRRGYFRELGQKGTLNTEKHYGKSRKKWLGMREVHESMVDYLIKKKKGTVNQSRFDKLIGWLQVLFPLAFAQLAKNTIFSGETYKEIGG